ncbi:hypothetical protein ACU4GR_16485 [Methylobacterium oryzae CBMB20]
MAARLDALAEEGKGAAIADAIFDSDLEVLGRAIVGREVLGRRVRPRARARTGPGRRRARHDGCRWGGGRRARGRDLGLPRAAAARRRRSSRSPPRRRSCRCCASTRRGCSRVTTWWRRP